MFAYAKLNLDHHYYLLYSKETFMTIRNSVCPLKINKQPTDFPLLNGEALG